jgi:hypothetical protein
MRVSVELSAVISRKISVCDEHMQEQLSYERRLEIASRLCEALRLLYPDKVITLSDTRALRLAQDPRGDASSGCD